MTWELRGEAATNTMSGTRILGGQQQSAKAHSGPRKRKGYTWFSAGLSNRD